jgi:hypothetical protein
MVSCHNHFEGGPLSQARSSCSNGGLIVIIGRVFGEQNAKTPKWWNGKIVSTMLQSNKLVVAVRNVVSLSLLSVLGTRKNNDTHVGCVLHDKFGHMFGYMMERDFGRVWISLFSPCTDL